MNSSKAHVFLTAMVSITMANTASADLILAIDAAAKTYTFSGSDSGTTAASGTDAIAAWEVFDFAAPAADFSTFQTDSIWTGLNPDRNNAFQVSMVFSGFPAHRSIQFSGVGSSQSPTLSTVTASGVVVDYSSMHATDQLWFEGLIGSSIPNTFGSGFSPVGIEASASAAAVPEPSSFALLGLGGIGLLVHRRRKSRLIEQDDSASC